MGKTRGRAFQAEQTACAKVFDLRERGQGKDSVDTQQEREGDAR